MQTVNQSSEEVDVHGSLDSTLAGLDMDDTGKVPGSGKRKRKKPPERNPSYRGQMLNRWPRAFARIFDLTWQLAVVITGLVILLGERSTELFNPSSPAFYLLLFASLPLALFLDAIIAGVLGNTPAKALVGVKATTSRGESLGIAKHLKRSYGVWTDGFAMGFLPLTLFTFVRQFKRVSGRREAIYDERLHARVRSGRFTAARTLLPVIVLAGTLVLLTIDFSPTKLLDTATSNSSTESTPETQ